MPTPIAYRIVPQTPPLDARELDSVETAVEVVIVWGGLSVLHVAHLSPPRPFYLGETDADFWLGAETLGAERLPIVLAEGGAPSVVIPAAASGELEIGGESVGFDALEAQSLLRPVPGFGAARQYPLASGVCARIRHGELTFIVRAVAAGQRVGAAGRATFDWRRHRWTFASGALHLALLGLFFALPPHSLGLSLDTIHPSSRLVQYAILANEPPPEPPPSWTDQTGAAAPGGGARARDDEGLAGAPDAPKVQRRRAVAGPPDNPDPVLDRQLVEAAASNAGIIGLLKASAATDASLFNADTARGADPAHAIGALFGANPGESWGWNGLGMRGTGVGGGGDATGTVGLGNVGTQGIGGYGPGGYGYGGTGVGGFRNREARVPRIRTGGQIDTFGSLSKEVIRRVINRHIAEVRYCYEQRLIARPDLQGRVQVKFAISPTGAVQSAAVVGSDVGDPTLGNCVAQAVKRWDFPAPEGGGLVVVTYPFLFSSTGG